MVFAGAPVVRGQSGSEFLEAHCAPGGGLVEQTPALFLENEHVGGLRRYSQPTLHCLTPVAGAWGAWNDGSTPRSCHQLSRPTASAESSGEHHHSRQTAALHFPPNNIQPRIQLCGAGILASEKKKKKKQECSLRQGCDHRVLETPPSRPKKKKKNWQIN